MANFPKIRPLLEQALSLDLGNPNGTISNLERNIREQAITLGTLDYYRCFPMKSVYITTYNSSTSGENVVWPGTAPMKDDNGMYIDFKDLLTRGQPAIPQEQLENAYVLGLLSVTRPAFSNLQNPSVWSTQMFGFIYGSSSTNVDITSQLVQNSYDELSTGQAEYWIDRTKNRIHLISPFGLGQISIISALGFTTPEYVDMSKFDWLCKFVSYRFIESIITARESLQLEADFTISTDALQRRLEKLKEETDSLKNDSVLHGHLGWS